MHYFDPNTRYSKAVHRASDRAASYARRIEHRRSAGFVNSQVVQPRVLHAVAAIGNCRLQNFRTVVFGNTGVVGAHIDVVVAVEFNVVVVSADRCVCPGSTVVGRFPDVARCQTGINDAGTIFFQAHNIAGSRSVHKRPVVSCIGRAVNAVIAACQKGGIVHRQNAPQGNVSWKAVAFGVQLSPLSVDT